MVVQSLIALEQILNVEPSLAEQGRSEAEEGSTFKIIPTSSFA